VLPLLIGLGTAAGCSEELGPEKFETTRIKGRVISNAKPVTTGWVEILPTEGTMGNLRTAKIQPDGTFETDGTPVGKVAIILVKIPPDQYPTPFGTVPSLVFQVVNSPIRRTIPPGTECRVDLDLGVEAFRYAQEREAQKKNITGE
jgi:hypothetical protein